MAASPSSPTPSISISSSNIYPPLPIPSSVHSSRQNSLDIPSATPNSRLPKRNRSALRQFYGLSSSGQLLPELDRENFVEAEYVEKLLAEKTAQELLSAENELVNDIRGLDGERKALVYDNYSKLIAATDTIRRMRASMEPLTPTTSTLEPAVSHIESVSRELVVGMRAASPRPERKGAETVRWALGAPERIRELVGAGDREGAERAWELLRGVCGRWEGTRGVEELRKRGEEALGVREVGKMEGGELKVGKMETGEVEAGK